MKLLGKVVDRAYTVKTLVETGIVRPQRPDRLVRVGLTLHRWGPTLAAGAITSAVRHPDQLAVIDELGTLTWQEVHERSNALAAGLADAGIGEGDGVAILCRNHRGFIDATLACMKLGTTALYLNTAFAAPQITDVVKRENPKALIYDQEFAGLTAEAGEAAQALPGLDRRHGRPRQGPALEDLIAAGDRSDPVPPANPGRVVILTSGTTGTPKGAHRKQPESLDPVAGLLLQDPAARGRAHDDRRADVPLVGHGALLARAGAGLHDGPAPPLRPRGHDRDHRRATPARRSSSCP